MTLISNEASGRPTDWRREQVSLAFAKIDITCWTLLRTIPGSSYSAPVQGMTSWDLSAAATQRRSLIEAYHILCYLLHEPANQTERDFQKLLWEYHTEYERHEMMRSGVLNSRHEDLAGAYKFLTIHKV